MNLWLLRKTWRETWLMTVLLGVALCFVEGLLAAILPTIWEQMGGPFLESEFFQSMIRGLLSADVGARLSVENISAVAWIHPAVLTLFMAGAITVCTRFPAGEVDNGTADILLSMPVSRFQIVAHEAIAWLVGGVFLVCCALLGHTVGSTFGESSARQPGAYVLIVCVNLFCLYTAVAGLSCLAATLARRRGQAIAVMLATIVGSLLINFLIQAWPPAQHISFLSLLTYYRPFAVLQSGGWPTGDIAVLLMVGGCSWTLSAIRVVRRDI